VEQRHEQIESASAIAAETAAPATNASGSERERIVLSDEQVRLIVDGELCLACEGRKRAGQSFCPTDFVALGLYARIQLSKGLNVGNPVFCDVFRSALRHLQLNPQRMRKLAVRSGEWRYSSEEDLEKAGYRFIQHGECEVPGCGARIVWYWTPQDHKCCVNLDNYQPHRTSCADAEYFQRRREAKALQSSARRKRRAR
jgi:hypothetical protein